jgi:hypothetical protein
MTKEQKQLVDEITLLESEIKQLVLQIRKSEIENNEFKVKVVTLRDKLRQLYLKLKEITEAQKSPNPPSE